MQGFKPTSVLQVLAADRAAWIRLSELTPDGIRADSAGNLPLDALWSRMETDPKVVFHLLPQASAGHAAPGSAKRNADQAGLDQDPGSLKPGKKPRKGKVKGSRLKNLPMFRMSSKACAHSQRPENAAVGRLT